MLRDKLFGTVPKHKWLSPTQTTCLCPERLRIAYWVFNANAFGHGQDEFLQTAIRIRVGPHLHLKKIMFATTCQTRTFMVFPQQAAAMHYGLLLNRNCSVILTDKRPPRLVSYTYTGNKLIGRHAMEMVARTSICGQMFPA